MKHLKITRRFLLLAALCAPVAALAAPYAKPVGEVEIWRDEWRDAERNREIPVKVYYPQTGRNLPVIIFSHGLGGSREGYEYLGRYWAGRGYVSVHLQHAGSDRGVIEGFDMKRVAAAANAQNAIARARDVSFALNQLQVLDKKVDFPLHARLDFEKIGMAGHSFGANTTLLASGMKMPLVNFPLADPRIKASIALSSPAPNGKNYDMMFGGIKIPMLHMTGTNDTSPIDRPGSTPADRRIPYQQIKGADGYLVVFDGGDHAVFSGQRWRGGPVASDKRSHELIQQTSLAFWDAYLKGEDAAKKWLQNDCAAEMGTSATFEKK